MIICPTTTEYTGGSLMLGAVTRMTAPVCLDRAPLKELWKNACSGGGELSICPADGLTFTIGTAEPVPTDGAEWSLKITPDGAAACSTDEKGLLHAFMTLLGMIRTESAEVGKECFLLPCGLYRDRPKLRNRMVHFCVFPETKLMMLRKLLRVSAMMGCTHAVVEFWGMIRLECCNELSWPEAYTKEEVRPLLEEARELGLEIIPMFNHLGHAPQSRSAMGKHVVLDQNPRRAGWFSDDGWVWRIDKPEVRQLLRQIRMELIELAGPGGWFHLGCDEAYEYAAGTEKASLLAEYLTEITAELKTAGRRPIVWGDMLLDQKLKEKDPTYCCNGKSAEVHKILMEQLPRDILIADWQYDAVNVPIETSLYFRDEGFEVLTAPWTHESSANGTAMIRTAEQYGLAGTMLTTWHTFFHEIPLLLRQMEEMHGEPLPTHDSWAAAAAVFRRAYFPEGRYPDAGWEEKQIPEWFR